VAPFEAFDSVEGIFSELGAPEVIEEGRSGPRHSIIRPSSAVKSRKGNCGGRRPKGTDPQK
jgi:hypothetical protein